MEASLETEWSAAVKEEAVEDCAGDALMFCIVYEGILTLVTRSATICAMQLRSCVSDLYDAVSRGVDSSLSKVKRMLGGERFNNLG